MTTTTRSTARPRPPLDHEMTLDGFAGFGGWGLGEECANGYAIDLAFNHDAHACAAYRVNHPGTRVLMSDAFEVHPLAADVEPGRPLAHAHFSPDCTHHSKARGAAPVSDRVRGLAWIVLAWGHHRRPRVITLENVEEFAQWGPTVTVSGKRIADPDRQGETFRAFIAALTTGLPRSTEADVVSEIRAAVGWMMPMSALRRGLGYVVEWRELRACDFGAPTIRKRFYLVARCDGEPIVWPAPTHGEPGSGLLPHRTAAECIDWSIPCPSIFMTKAQARAYYRRTGTRVIRPLKPNTLKRIAGGLRKHLFNDPQPFIIPITHAGNDDRARTIDAPMVTITTTNRGEHALVTPIMVGAGGTTGTGRPRRADKPLKTIKTEDRQAIVAAFMARHFGGMTSRDLRLPSPTTAARGTQNQLVAANLLSLRGTSRHGRPLDEPSPTLTSGGNHVGLAAVSLLHNTTGHGGGNVGAPIHTITTGNHAALVAAFLQTYYTASKRGHSAAEPAPTITTKDRLGLVIVTIAGEPYVVVDVGMRMLQPHELLLCQFGELAEDWVLHGTKTRQVAGIGNSVCPHVARAIVAANVRIRRVDREVAA